MSDFSHDEYFNRLKYEFDKKEKLITQSNKEIETLKKDYALTNQEKVKLFENAYYHNIINYQLREKLKKKEKVLEKVRIYIPKEFNPQIEKILSESSQVTLDDVETIIRKKLVNEESKRITSNSNIDENEDYKFVVNSTPPPPPSLFIQQQQQQDKNSTSSTILKKKKLVTSSSSSSSSTTDKSNDPPKKKRKLNNSTTTTNTSLSLSGGHEGGMKQSSSSSNNILTSNNRILTYYKKKYKIPKSIHFSHEIKQSSHVAALINYTENLLFTGCKGSINIWKNDNNGGGDHDEEKKNVKLSFTAPVYERDNYIRNMIVSPYNRSQVFVCGECSDIPIMEVDMLTNKVSKVGKLCTEKDSCVYGLCVSENGRNLFCGGNKWFIEMFDVVSKKSIQKFEGHQNSVSTVLMASHNHIVSGSIDKTIRLWDVRQNKKEVLRFDTLGENFTIAPYPLDNHLIVSGNNDGDIEFFNLHSGSHNSLCKSDHSDTIFIISYEKNGDWFLSCGKDEVIGITKGPFGPSLLSYKQEGTALCGSIYSNDDDKSPTIYIGFWDNCVRVYKTRIEDVDTEVYL